LANHPIIHNTDFKLILEVWRRPAGNGGLTPIGEGQ